MPAIPAVSSSIRRLCALATLAALAFPGVAAAERDVPVGVANTNDANLRDSDWLYAIRFVVDRDTTMYRFFSQMKAKGADWDEHPGSKCEHSGPGCYGAGDGGRIQARLVSVKPDGTPDLSNVLAEETVNPRKRYFETKAEYGIGTISLFWYYNTGGVSLRGGTTYAMVYRNVADDPAHNFSSANSPTVKESEAGPNGRNNLDPNAPGAIAGLDAREAVAWSDDGGRSWGWGRRTGPYFGSPSSDDGTRLPHYAWQSSPTARPESNQPYTAYWSTCSDCQLTLRSAPHATTLTEAGGYAPVGKSVGVVTVRNLRTGETGRTGPLGSGIVRGRLGNPVTITAGDSYAIQSSGTVFRAEADNYVVRILGLGGGAFPFTTGGQGPDRAELFALPHPWFGGTAATSPGVSHRGGPVRAVRLREATFASRILRRSRRGRRVVRRLRVVGDVLVVKRRGRIVVQVRRRGHWRSVGGTRLRGRRFALRARVAMRTGTRSVRLRAVTTGGGRSRAMRVRARR